jgi:hypothetical protein
MPARKQCRQTTSAPNDSPPPAAIGLEIRKRAVTNRRPFLVAHKKTAVAEHPGAFRHVGLLINAPTGTGRVALYLVIRWRRETSLLKTSPERHVFYLVQLRLQGLSFSIIHEFLFIRLFLPSIAASSTGKQNT